MNRKTGFVLAAIIIFALIVSVTIAAITFNPDFFNDNKPKNTPTPAPNATATPTPQNSPTASPTSHPKPTPTKTASTTSTPQSTVNPTAQPTPTATPTTPPTPTPTAPPTPTPTPTLEPTPIPTPTPTATPVPTPTPSPTPIPTPVPHPTVNPASILFSDDFAAGNMTGWTNTDTSGVTLGVVNKMLQCQTTVPTNGHWGYVYKWLNQSYSSLNWRWYLYFSDLPEVEGNIIGGGGIYNSAIEGNFTPTNGVCALNVVRLNGQCVWSLAYVDGNQVFSVNSTEPVASQTWYLVELRGVQAAGNGEVRCYINDQEILNATNLTNNHNSGIDHVSVGGGISADRPVTWYCASAIASTEHIGPKPSEAAVQYGSFGYAACGWMGFCLIFGTTLTSTVLVKRRSKRRPNHHNIN